jgi:hypothetical protein
MIMAEEKDTNFKITDRRKFNVDGTPRDAEAETTESAATAAQERSSPVQEPAIEETAADNTAAGNVVSFESAKKKERAEPEAAPAAQPESAAPKSEEARAASAAAEQAYNQAAGPKSTKLPEASFLGLVNMLAVEAAMHLGLIRTPEGVPPVDLESARHLLDMLGLLQQKTRGNLTSEEEDLLDNVLADLRMQFVALSRRK